MKDALARFQIELKQSQLQEMQELCELGNLRSKRELLDNAMTLLKWAVKQKRDGHSIASIGTLGEIRELEMPYLENVAFNSQRYPRLVGAETVPDGSSDADGGVSDAA